MLWRAKKVSHLLPRFIWWFGLAENTVDAATLAFLFSRWDKSLVQSDWHGWDLDESFVDFFVWDSLRVLLDSNLIFTIKSILQTSKSQAPKVLSRLHISDGLPHFVYSLLPLVKHKSSLYPAAHINTFYFVLHSHKNENINKNFQRHVLAIRRREVVSGCDNFCRCWWGSNRRLVGRSKRRAVEVAKEFPLRIFLGCKFTWNIIGWSERKSGTAALEKRRKRSAKFFYSS